MIANLIAWALILGLPWPLATAITHHIRRRARRTNPLDALARIHHPK